MTTRWPTCGSTTCSRCWRWRWARAPWAGCSRAARCAAAQIAPRPAASCDSLDRARGPRGPGRRAQGPGGHDRHVLARSPPFANQQRFVANASARAAHAAGGHPREVDVALADPDASAAELRETAERVSGDLIRSERLIESLLLLAQRGRGAAALERSTWRRPRHWHRRSRPSARATASSRDLRRARAHGDRRLLERLVANLVENAVRHAYPGGWATVATRGRRQRHLRVENSGRSCRRTASSVLDQPFQRLHRGAPAAVPAWGCRSCARWSRHTAARAGRRAARGGLRVAVELPRVGEPTPRTRRACRRARTRRAVSAALFLIAALRHRLARSRRRRCRGAPAPPPLSRGVTIRAAAGIQTVRPRRQERQRERRDRGVSYLRRCVRTGPCRSSRRRGTGASRMGP